MSISNYEFTSSFSPEFLSKFCDKELLQQKHNVTNYYKQYTWIQPNDSLLVTICKTALFCLTLTASLWITLLMDHYTTPDRETAFLRKLESLRPTTILNESFEQVLRDMFRMTLKVQNNHLYQIAWTALPKKNLSSSKPEIQEELRKLIQIPDFDQFRAPLQKRSPQCKTAISIIEKAIKSYIKQQTLPEIFNQLKQNHGVISALHICTAFNQSLPLHIGNYLFQRLVKIFAEKNVLMYYNCKSENPDQPSETKLSLDNDQLVLETTYKLNSVENVLPVLKAQLETQLVVDIKTLRSRIKINVIPLSTLTANEAKILNLAWGEWGFNMPIPTDRPHSKSDSN